MATRGGNDDSYDGATCSCGEAWFRLKDTDDGPGVVTLDQQGIVTGFSGKPVCMSCGLSWTPARERLRVVKNDDDMYTPDQVESLNRFFDSLGKLAPNSEPPSPQTDHWPTS